MSSKIILLFRDGRYKQFDAVEPFEVADSGVWLRCYRDEPSSRMGLPETTTYYRITSVERIECTTTAIADGGDDRPRCPICDEPIAFATVAGPSQATLSPCGHTVPMESLPDPDE